MHEESRRAPTVYPEVFAQEYRPYCDAILEALRALNFYISQFAKTVVQFDDALARLNETLALEPREDPTRLANKDLFLHWMENAGRCGALIVYDFGYACEGLTHALGRAPPIRDLMNMDLKDKATKLLHEYFKDRKFLRNGAAHVEETFLEEHTKGGKHAISDPAVVNAMNAFEGGEDFRSVHGQFAFGGSGGKDIFSGVRGPRHYLATWQHKLYELEIGEATTQKMRDVRDRFFNMFDVLEEKTREIAWAQRRAATPPTSATEDPK